MDIKISEGDFAHMGVYQEKESIVFTFEAEKKDTCSIVLISETDCKNIKIDIPDEYSLGSIRSVRIKGIKPYDFSYYFMINGRKRMDPYATAIKGREIWNDAERKKSDYEIYCKIANQKFSWKDDHAPEILKSDMIIYKLNIRSFSMDLVSGRKECGTFKAVMRKIKYLKELGITSLLFMPVYEFEEMNIPPKVEIPEYAKNKTKIAQKTDETVQKTDKVNMWGYGDGSYFAVKASYAYDPKNAASEFKSLVKKLHENNMECIMEMHFMDTANHNLIIEALRFWVKEYHVDGFKLIGDNLPVTAIVQDLLLSRTKILYEDFDLSSVPDGRTYENLYIDKEEYMYPARKVLNHMNADMKELLDQQRKQGDGYGFINYIAGNNGFTLCDLFMYNDKHNENNGEDNKDGAVWNFSNNYGVEGPSNKKYIKSIRRLKWKNAMMLLFLAQGVPAVMAGDEFENSQSGNNNAYCQDNETGWVNWKNERKNRKNIQFLKDLISFRKKYPIISNPKPFKFCDYKTTGYPDLSYHGSSAWISQFDLDRMCVGTMYCGEYSSDNKEYVYIAYNFYSYREMLALPKLQKGKKWYKIADSSRNENIFSYDAAPSKDQQFVQMEPQAVCILIGK